jgi:hypothetical protein
MDKMLGELSKVWGKLTAGEKMGAIQQAGSDIIKAEEVAKLPADVQAIYAEMDAFAAKIYRLSAAADKATKAGDTKGAQSLIDQAAQLEAERLRHEKQVEALLAAYEAAAAAAPASIEAGTIYAPGAAPSNVTPATVAAAVSAAPQSGGGTLIVQIGNDIIGRFTDEMLYIRGSLTTIPVP